jgi:hypothetical protein
MVEVGAEAVVLRHIERQLQFCELRALRVCLGLQSGKHLMISKAFAQKMAQAKGQNLALTVFNVPSSHQSGFYCRLRVVHLERPTRHAISGRELSLN